MNQPAATTRPDQTVRSYRVYGLSVASQVELPELESIPIPETADAEIRYATLPDNLEGATSHGSWLQVTPDACQLRVDGVALFRIAHGCTITIDNRLSDTPAAPASAGDMRLYLLGSAFSALLHQRRWLPLHCSAVLTPAGVWAFTGPSGAGKSTTAAHLHYVHGWPLISDDVAVIKPSDASPRLHPGPKRLKLWRDALETLNVEPRGLTRDTSPAEKYHLRVDPWREKEPLVMNGLVLLERSDEGEPPNLEQVTGIEAFKALMGTMYRPEIGHHYQRPEDLLRQCARVANHIETVRYRRPWGNDLLATSLEPLIEHLSHPRAP